MLNGETSISGVGVRNCQRILWSSPGCHFHFHFHLLSFLFFFTSNTLLNCICHSASTRYSTYVQHVEYTAADTSGLRRTGSNLNMGRHSTRAGCSRQQLRGRHLRSRLEINFSTPNARQMHNCPFCLQSVLLPPLKMHLLEDLLS